LCGKMIDVPVKIPDAEPVWAEGFVARLQGAERLDNPYLDAADGREDQWDDGWFHAENEIAKVSLPKSELPR
jgi:hypothetical protein